MLHNLSGAARRLGRAGSSEATYDEAVDRLIAAYVYWREKAIAARGAYSRCGAMRGHSLRYALAAYFAALNREERAAAEYAACVDQVNALVSREGGSS